MIVLFELIVLCCIWNIGVEIVLSEGMALYKVRLWAENKSSRIFEPLITCVWCRPSVHCFIGYAAAYDLGIIDCFTWNAVVLYPFVVAGTSFISGVIWNFYRYIDIKSKYYNHKEQQEYFNLKERKINYTKNKK